ncbi:MAG: acyltransferase family protein [Sporolactobacillus sp.]
MKLIDLNLGRNNNFDFIRFIAALLVIFSHSFPLSGNGGLEPLYMLTNGKATIGSLAVAIFFITSGFLITMSYMHTKDPIKFIKSRCLRIFPALIVVVLLSSFVLGPIVSNMNAYQYFTNYQTYDYLKTIFLYPIQYDLPGVFVNNPYQIAVNGSLWTLSIEFTCYIFVLLLGIFKLLNKKIILAAFILSLIVPQFTISPLIDPYTHLFRYFFAGIFIYIFQDKVSIKSSWFLASLILLTLSTISGHMNIGFAVFGSYIITYLAFSPKIKFHKFAKYGDFSYGLYIIAFPIQQTITFVLNGKISPILLFIIASVIALILSSLSWHLIEKPALGLKNKSILHVFKKANVLGTYK